jgi:O-antigen ligase
MGMIAIALTGAILPFILGEADYNYVTGAPRYEIALAVFYALAGACALIHRRQVLAMARRSPVLLSLLFLVCISVGWAETPGLVARSALAVLGTTLFGVLLAARFTLAERLDLLSKVFHVLAILSVIFVIFLPQYGISTAAHSGAWAGVFNQKNELGSVIALGILVDWYRPMQKLPRCFWLAVYGVLLMKSNSISPTMALLFTLLSVKTFQIFRMRYRVRPLAMVLMMPVVGTILLAIAAPSGLLQYASGRSADLSGRTELWRKLLPAVSLHPLFGYGYGDFWGGASKEFYDLTRKIEWVPMYSHNGYLEMVISLGIVGLILASLFLAKGLYQAILQADLGDSIEDLWPLAFLIFFLIHNTAECTIMRKNSLEWALCVATVLDLMSSRMHPAGAMIKPNRIAEVLEPSQEYA